MVTDTAFFRNPNYHEKTDTMDTLYFVRMNEVVKERGVLEHSEYGVILLTIQSGQDSC